MNTEPEKELNYDCSCKFPKMNDSIVIQNGHSNKTAMETCLDEGGILFGRGCATPTYYPDVFLFSFILFIFTYIISVKLKDFRQTRFLGAKTREYISDFSVPIAITVMTVTDALVGIGTPKLQVPNNFEVGMLINNAMSIHFILFVTPKHSPLCLIEFGLCTPLCRRIPSGCHWLLVCQPSWALFSFSWTSRLPQ